ncbi:MAG: ABC transporter ATP-binding protein [Gemmataceae bacterium]
MTPPVLEVIDVRKSYGATLALDGVRFQVAEGEMFGLLGPNGAGKTTLLSILSCLLRADAGEVRLLGRAISPDDREARRQLGIVPQELAIYGELTAAENLDFFGRLYGLRGAELRQRVADVLAAVGLRDRAQDRAQTFSGGMQRRLNLGASLMHRPRLLLLDEPTTGVDPQSRNHIFEEVRRLNAAGMTIIYTSHYMEEVQALCSRVGIIDHGRLIACDNVSALLRRLDSVIRVRVTEITPSLRERLKVGQHLREVDGSTLEIECADVPATLAALMKTLHEERENLIGLETQEPNLERVFLHLTGRDLRD